MRYIEMPSQLPDNLRSWQEKSDRLVAEMKEAIKEENVLQKIAKNAVDTKHFPESWQDTVTKKNWPSDESDRQLKAQEIWDSLTPEQKHTISLAVRSSILSKNEDHWKNDTLRDYLRSLSLGKCWYTEVKFAADYPQVEHFRPKASVKNENKEVCHDGYWWLAFSYSNYRLAKPMPNIRKGIYFPLRRRAMAACDPGTPISYEIPMLLDPANEEDVAMLGFNSHGMPEPCKEPMTDFDDWDLKRIEFSIEAYGLNDVDLCEERKALWGQITAMLNEYGAHWKNYKDNECLISHGKAEQLLKEIRKFLTPDQQYTALIRDCFNDHRVGRFLVRSYTKNQRAA